MDFVCVQYLHNVEQCFRSQAPYNCPADAAFLMLFREFENDAFSLVLPLN